MEKLAIKDDESSGSGLGTASPSPRVPAPGGAVSFAPGTEGTPVPGLVGATLDSFHTPVNKGGVDEAGSDEDEPGSGEEAPRAGTRRNTPLEGKKNRWLAVMNEETECNKNLAELVAMHMKSDNSDAAAATLEEVFPGTCQKFEEVDGRVVRTKPPALCFCHSFSFNAIPLEL